MQKILLVEDEPTINRMISNYLINEGYQVIQAYDGDQALALFQIGGFHLVCLDIMLPKKSGWEVATLIRKKSKVPIIMMSALSDEEDIIKGYDLKVDDYITKPFNPRVLMAKINNMLERIGETSFSSNDTFETHHLIVDLKKHLIYLDQEKLDLSRKEYDLFKTLIMHEKVIMSRENLHKSVWGSGVKSEPRLVDTYIKKIRKQIQPYDFIKTVFGVGYRFESYD